MSRTCAEKVNNQMSYLTHGKSASRTHVNTSTAQPRQLSVGTRMKTAQPRQLSVATRMKTAQPRQLSVATRMKTAQPRQLSVATRMMTAHPRQLSVATRMMTAQPRQLSVAYSHEAANFPCSPVSRINHSEIRSIVIDQHNI